MILSAARDLPGIGWDPTPGDVELTRRLATTVQDTADSLRECSTLLDTEMGGMLWHGEFADFFRASMTTFSRRFTDAVESLRLTAAALNQWAGDLADLQRETDSLERRMLRLRAAETAAREELDRQVHLRAVRVAQQVHKNPLAYVDADPLGEHARADRAHKAAVAAVRAAERTAEGLYEDFLTRARRRAKAIRDARESFPGRGGVFAAAEHLAKRTWETIDDGVGTQVRRHAHDLDRFRDVAAPASTALEVAGVIPGLGLPLAETGVTLSLGSAGADATLATFAEGSAGTVVVDAAGMGATKGLKALRRRATPGRSGFRERLDDATDVVLVHEASRLAGALLPPDPEQWENPAYAATATVSVAEPPPPLRHDLRAIIGRARRNRRPAMVRAESGKD